jgi:hypothetical protein
MIWLTRDWLKLYNMDLVDGVNIISCGAYSDLVVT